MCSGAVQEQGGLDLLQDNYSAAKQTSWASCYSEAAAKFLTWADDVCTEEFCNPPLVDDNQSILYTAVLCLREWADKLANRELLGR